MIFLKHLAELLDMTVETDHLLCRVHLVRIEGNFLNETRFIKVPYSMGPQGIKEPLFKALFIVLDRFGGTFFDEEKLFLDEVYAACHILGDVTAFFLPHRVQMEQSRLDGIQHMGPERFKIDLCLPGDDHFRTFCHKKNLPPLINRAFTSAQKG